ncbi:MAG: hypothetical protein Q8N79_08015 [Candidatus Methanoperedens sp.]|nr:hypothetical protein [Candidatus Methanoperedens sp.]
MRRTKPYDREFAIPLIRNTFIRVGFDLKNGQVLDFRVQLELHKNDEIKVIRRYDTAHGRPHVDKYDRPDPKTGEYEKIFFDINNMKGCISSAINYLKENHVIIIERYLRKHKND